MYSLYKGGMHTQNQVKKTLSEPKVVEQINILLSEETEISRAELASQICEKYGFFDSTGKKQITSCSKALRQFEKNGLIKLPEATKSGPGIKTHLRLEEGVSEPVNVPDRAGEIAGLELIVVETEKKRRIWNELMIREHPISAGHPVGCQIKYLITSEHGWLGGLGFSSSSIHLEDRDKWIGWDWPLRQATLHYVVNLSRYLIRPCIECKNLASHVLGLATKKFPNDFEKRYNFKPLLLESFVDTTNYSGTCYKAANWQLIGKTKGRGRQDSLREYQKTVKDIYVYELDKSFREKIGLPEYSGLSTLPLEALPCANWAEKEFANIYLGDKRLENRLSEIAEDVYKNPSASYSTCVGGAWKKVKGFYRLIDKPIESAVSMANILAPHREQTIRRMKAHKTVLCIQDGSSLNYNNLNKCEGLGEIGKNQSGVATRGLYMHSMLAVTTEGLPLGVLNSDIVAPEIKKEKKTKNELKHTPIEEKRLFSWIEGIRDCALIKSSIPHTKLINVMDREGDFFELFDYQRCNYKNTELLVRASFNRRIGETNKLFDKLRSSPVLSTLEIKVPRQSQRFKKGKQKAKPKKKERIAKASIRYEKINLKAPHYSKNQEPINLWVVHVSEDNPPENTEPIEWFLLTTIKIESSEKACECLKWYCLRWRIEDWHRVLKSGCKIEELAFKTAERLKRAIAIKMVVAWRIMLMTLMGRQTPGLPPEVLFSDIEIKVLQSYAEKKT